MPPMPVDVDTARIRPIVDAVRATGRIEAVQAVELRSDEQGRITGLLFREGQFVSKGAPLVKIDDAMLRARPSVRMRIAISRSSSSRVCVGCVSRMLRRLPISSAPKRLRGARMRPCRCSSCRSRALPCARRSPEWSASVS